MYWQYFVYYVFWSWRFLVTVDIENFGFCQQTIADEHDYIKPKRTITAEFDEKYNVYVLNFSLDKFHKETI